MGQNGQAADRIAVSVVYSPAPRQIKSMSLLLEAGASVADALQAAQQQGLDIEGWQVGVWGRKAAPTRRLLDGDRIELYRALQVDPKKARRERFKKQGVGVAGLFSRKKQNSS